MTHDEKAPQKVIPPEFQASPAMLDAVYPSHYWHLAVRTGLQYFVSGRYAAIAGLTPVSGNLLHHAVEMLLKSCLARQDSADTIRKYHYKKPNGYGHSLGALWAELKCRRPDIDGAQHDVTVAELDKFDGIRYPEPLMKAGGYLAIEIHDGTPALSAHPAHLVPEYTLRLPPIDRLVECIFRMTHYNPEALATEFSRVEAATYLRLHNTAALW
jgi:hypothetical protein